MWVKWQLHAKFSDCSGEECPRLPTWSVVVLLPKAESMRGEMEKAGGLGKLGDGGEESLLLALDVVKAAGVLSCVKPGRGSDSK